MYGMGTRASLLVFSLLWLTSCSNLSTTGVNAEDLETARQLHGRPLQQMVDDLVAPMVETGHTPGVIAGVLLPDGRMYFSGYGVADQSTGQKPDADTLFAIGSLSKGFLAAITARLVDRGLLSWDDTLRDLLPPDVPLSDDAAKITLLQLATHTSGLPRQPVNLRTLDYFTEYLFDGENFYRHFDSDYILDYLTSFETDRPGFPRYSNVGYGLLGYILEQRTGKSVDSLLAEEITKPLGLHCTDYESEHQPCTANRAHGYAGDQPLFIPRGDPTPDWHFTHFMRGSAALSSTARDLLTFAAAHLTNQKNPLNATLARNMQVRFPRPKEAAALAWVVDDVEGEPISYQIGIVAGYTSYLGIDVLHKTAAVIIQNSFNWDNSVGHRLLLDLRYIDVQSPF